MIRIQRGAMTLAHLAAIETEGSSAARSEAAIWAYLWALENRVEQGTHSYWPSLDQLREALAEARRERAIL